MATEEQYEEQAPDDEEGDETPGYQGHLYIGVRLRDDNQHLLEMLKGLGLRLPRWAPMPSSRDEDWNYVDPYTREETIRFREIVDRKVTIRDREYRLTLSDFRGAWFGSSARRTGEDDTQVVFGYALTGQELGMGLLDADEQHGRSEPYELDLGLIAEFLAAVQSWWPEARLFIMTERLSLEGEAHMMSLYQAIFKGEEQHGLPHPPLRGAN